MCTCLRKQSRSISCWRSALCWHKSIFERFLSFHIKDESRLRTNCTTSKRRRCVKIFESSVYHILWFENSLVKKSWFRSCCFSHCTVVLREWFFLSFFWVSRVLRVRIALIAAWCRFVEWSSQTRCERNLSNKRRCRCGLQFIHRRRFFFYIVLRQIYISFHHEIVLCLFIAWYL